jgi:hypothetical protein
METWFMGSVKIFFAGGQLMIKDEILRVAEKMRCAFFSESGFNRVFLGKGQMGEIDP